MHQNSPFFQIRNKLKKFWGGGTRPRIAGETRLLSQTTLSTGSDAGSDLTGAGC